jgi:beta-lactamase class A
VVINKKDRGFYEFMNRDRLSHGIYSPGIKQDVSLSDNLKQEIVKLISDAKAKVSLLIEDYNTDKAIISYDEDKKMVSASIIKVLILLATLEKVKSGVLTLDTVIPINAGNILEDTEVFELGEQDYTIDELLTWMIINSDNTATNYFIDLLTMDYINSYATNLSLKHTKLERKMLDFKAIDLGFNNYTSTFDMNILFKALYHQSILTPELCNYALSILKRQRHKQLSTRYIYDDVTIAHKTGSLDNLYHDAGIFYLGHVNYYFGMFVCDAENNDYAAKLIGRISKMVYEYYKKSDDLLTARQLKL